MRRFLRRVSSVLLAMVMTALLLYALLPWLVEGLLRSRLRDAGFTAAGVDVGYPGWHGMALRNLALELDLPANLLRVAVPELRLGYTLASLRGGKLDTISIDGGTVDLGPPVRPAAASELALPLPGPWLAELPFDAVQVSGMTLREREADRTLREGVLVGAARRKADRLTAEFTLHRDAQELATAALVLAGDGVFDLVLRPGASTDTAAASISMRLLPAGDDRIDIQGTVALHPSRLLSLWNPAAKSNLSGNMTGNLHGTLPAAALRDSDRIWGGAELELYLESSLTAEAIDGIGRKLALAANADARLQGGSLELVVKGGTRFSGLLEALQPESRFAVTAEEQPPAPVTILLGLDARLTLTRNDDSWEIAVPSGLGLTLQDTLLHGYSIPKLELRTRGKGRIRLAVNGAAPFVDVGFSMQAPGIVSPFAGIGQLSDLTATARVISDAAGIRAEATDVGLTLLGGRLRIPTLEYLFGAAVPPFELYVEHLDLAQVVALEHRSDLEASGLLDGVLPITVTAGGVEINAGQLDARAPGGVIRFRPGGEARALGGGNAGLELVYKALSNLHYQRLDTRLDYRADGRLTLATVLAGRNPDWNNGQPVNLNLNLEDNVQQLLRSLYIGERLGKEFEQMVQDRYKAQREGH